MLFVLHMVLQFVTVGVIRPTIALARYIARLSVRVGKAVAATTVRAYRAARAAWLARRARGNHRVKARGAHARTAASLVSSLRPAPGVLVRSGGQHHRR